MTRFLQAASRALQPASFAETLYSRVVFSEHEGHWLVSQKAMRVTGEFIGKVAPDDPAISALVGTALFIRSNL